MRQFCNVAQTPLTFSTDGRHWSSLHDRQLPDVFHGRRLHGRQFVDVFGRTPLQFWVLAGSCRSHQQRRIAWPTLNRPVTASVTNTVLSDLAEAFEWAIFQWGADGNGCFGFVAQNGDWLRRYSSIATGARRWGGPPQPLMAIEYVVNTNAADTCRARLFDEAMPGRRIWQWACSTTGIPRVVCPDPSGYCPGQWPHGNYDVLCTIPRTSRGDPLWLCSPHNERSFVQMCFQSLASSNGGMWALPASCDVSELTAAIQSTFDEGFLWDCQMLRYMEWVFSSGRSYGDVSHLYLAAHDHSLLRGFESGDGDITLLAFL
jgi:hypothetical protein